MVNSTALAQLFTRQDQALAAAITTDALLLGVVLGLAVVVQTRYRYFYFENALQRSRGPAPPAGVFGWVGFVLRMPESQIEEVAGLDALVFLHFIRTMLGVLLLFTASFGLLEVAVYVGCSFAVPEEFFPAGWSARLSLANVPKASEHQRCTYVTLAVSAVGMNCLTLLTLWALRRGWVRIVAARRRFMIAARDASARVVLVLGAPTAPVQHRDAVLQLWHELHPGAVLDVRMVRDCGSLPKLLAQREKLRQQIGGEVWAHPGCCRRAAALVAPPRRAVVQAEEGELILPADQAARRHSLLQKAREVDAAVAAELRARTAEEADAGRHFLILFSSLRAASAAQRLVHTETDAQVVHAPLPQDVRYEPLQPHGLLLAAAALPAMRALYVAVLFFYSIPITFVSTLLQVPTLERHSPLIKSVLDALGPAVTAFLTSFLPTVALLVFTAMLPSICVFLSESEGWPSHSLVQKQAFEKLFLFEFVWVFIGVAIASGLVASISSFVSDPTSALNTIGGSLASTSNFFFTLMLLQAAFSLPYGEVRLIPLLLHLSKRLVQKKTAPAPAAPHPASENLNRRLISQPPSSSSESVPQPSHAPPAAPPAEEVPPSNPPYHVLWSKVMMGVTIGVCFANVHLIATVAAVVYLAVCYVLFARAILFSHTNQFESCGRHFWPSACGWVLRILFTAQLLLAAVHSLKESFVTAALSLLPAVFAYLGHRHFNKVYLAQLDVLPLLYSVRADDALRRGEVRDVTAEERKAFETLYGEEIGVASDGTAVGTIDGDRDGDPSGNKKVIEHFRSLYMQKELEWPDGLQLSAV
ncbi:hypothetical protein AB1Y20_001684 [Prymnesium parvum]|uniref:CSC1/OSCA1-like 7TM region domain-containing protein n=1 Tax=Prymnesium parvum TaxID=97485 RepID=A0AB34KCC9_PRYPA